jgi:uncharacterized protein YbjQ (UPF0145 family)
MKVDVSQIPALIDGTPSGWYPDPTGTKKARYWSGSTWTDNARNDVSPRAVPTADEVQREGSALAAALAADTRWRTVVLTTSHELPDARIVRHVGEVFGITVRTRNLFSNAVANVRGVVGGEVGSYTKLMVAARLESLERLRREADGMGANAVISMRLDANQIQSEMTEFVAYGAAVVIEPIADGAEQPST